jgi:predicted ATP-grasp superfamily ATP-dependent carboligase
MGAASAVSARFQAASRSTRESQISACLVTPRIYVGGAPAVLKGCDGVGRSGGNTISGVGACLIGDYDVARPLAMAGLEVVVVADPRDRVRYSRAARRVVERDDPWSRREQLVQRLVELGESLGGRPPLFYQSDGDLLTVSRNRTALEPVFRYLLPPEELVEDLVDKQRFQVLADRLGLPVPPARVIRSADQEAPDLALPFVVKPMWRRDLEALGLVAKALIVETRAQADELMERVRRAGVDVLAQELIAGPESRIESYHAYVSADGRTLGEFTGRKLRTWPQEYGHTTALTTTDAADVRELGRDVMERLGLHGVAKVDFKRDDAGRLHLLEVNPRFNLWHHVGAVAGVNLPAIAHADLTGAPLPAGRPAAAGVHWSEPWSDRWAWAAEGRSFASWLRFEARCPARSGFAWNDPMPLVRGVLVPGVTRRIRGVRAA